MPATTEPWTAGGEHAFAFGPFQLVPAQRLLLEGGKPVRLGSRAFDILAALVASAGEVIGKEELIARVWPQTFVEESNLKIQVSALRRALGDGQGGHRYIVNIPGRGYNFVTPVSVREASRASLPPTAAPARVHNLPLAMTRMIGRDETMTAIVSRLSRQRLVTIVGPGGIGKTTVSLAVAEQLIAGYEDGVWLVDLAPLGDPRLVSSAVATVFGLEVSTEDPLPGLVASLRNKRILLLLDNCEHVIEAVANVAEAILGSTRDVNILATSREPLGAAGEREYRLGPLASPGPDDCITASEALAFPAVQLFVERTSAIIEDFVLTNGEAPLVVEICRRLDGLPLAIEFAAARVEVLGISGLAANLSDRLQVLAGRRRSAIPRHRTIRAVLDWSYGLLSEDEKRFFRRLGIFSASFSIQAVARIVMDTPEPSVDVVDLLADLAAKSLLSADIGGAEPRFRLLETTRLYALEKLGEIGERQEIARRYAEFYQELYERAAGEWERRPTTEWLDLYGWQIDGLRAALDWAFSPDGEASIGVALTIAAVPLWMQLSLLEECRRRAKQALGALETGGTQDRRQEMRLHAALGGSSPEAPEMGAAFATVLDIAESLGDIDYQLRALRGLYFDHIANSRYRAALPFAQKFHHLATSGSNPSDQLFAERMLGVAKHFVGEQTNARRHLEHVLMQHALSDHRQDVVRFQIDSRLSARVFLARVLWLQGFPDQAVRAAELSVAESQASGHAASLCYVLTTAACPIALWVGDLAAAARYAEVLLDHSSRHSLPFYRAFVSRFQIVVDLKGGHTDRGLRLLHAAIAESRTRFPFLTGLAELSAAIEALGQAGKITEGLAFVEAGIAQSEGGWLTPELLRLKGELLLMQNAAADAETAECLFQQARGEAHQQEALSLELRAATSLARFLRDQGRAAEALRNLEPVYDRFTEGFGTADLIAAKQLLNELNDVGRD